jgi:hypothetical protein
MKRSKRGSSAVFLTVVLAALMSVTLALIYGARAECVKSRVDAVLNLAGDSVMSEYDSDIQQEYGIFLLSGDNEKLGEKLQRYAEYSLKDMEDVNIEAVKVSGSRFSTANIDLVKEQILEYMELAVAEDGFAMWKSGTEKDINETDTEGRSLKHGPTAVSLPSAALPDKSLTALAESAASNVKEIDKAFEKGTEAYLINKYILTHFNSKTYKAESEHFFNNEAEYILGGELTDRKNEKRVEMALKAMRFPLNLAHIYSDSKKNAATLAMAEILTPEAAPATQALLASTWAYAESDNDVKILWQGGKVPITKDESTWAVDLDSAVEGITQGIFKPEAERGYDYSKYLQVLLFFKDENVKISRIMDLIQINTRMSYNGDFLINECFTGISIDVKVNGVDYGYEKKY